MFDIRGQEQRISELKASLHAQRLTAAHQLRTLVPHTRKTALVGTLLWGARKALPLLQPLVIGIVSKGVGKFSPRFLLKALSLSGLAFAAWRLFRSDWRDKA